MLPLLPTGRPASSGCQAGLLGNEWFLISVFRITGISYALCPPLYLDSAMWVKQRRLEQFGGLLKIYFPLNSGRICLQSNPIYSASIGTHSGRNTLRDKETIDKELEEARKELAECKGTQTEVYQRITGYYRALHNWGIGKAEEYHHRKVFAVPESCSQASSVV